ncbi:outer membrane protein assembly factor BamE [Aquitalea aquatica]|uniref:Outer membrane protein assembly factor BamE n=1 Tax=Aquitalea aquatica TaxID=3044273 RepID=A0A838YBD0_9NEIS|nr:outer membrane protein assembly factor BamE [Aquitalea magnusonii]MBA4710702.1 outer membrane protein assembly factor BamE [Aquitalea magnusonii]
MRALIIAAVIALSGCTSMNPINWITPHKMEIQQGNYVTEDAVAKLKPGMTRSQVRFLLGTPLLTDSFHNNRWDYPYQDSKQGKLVDKKLLTVFFEGDTMVRVEGTAQPAERAILPLDASAPAKQAPEAPKQ